MAKSARRGDHLATPVILNLVVFLFAVYIMAIVT